MTWNKKHSTKQVVQWYTHLGKTFAAATFKGL